MELTPYEECLDLMNFYEVYCSKDSGVVEGSISGWLVILVQALVVGGLIALNERRKKSRDQ